MALYTPAQWAKIQANMPPEDRVSYAEYVNQAGGALEQLKTAESTSATTGPTAISAVESAAAARAKVAADKKVADEAAAKLAAETAYYTAKVGNTGLTQAQIDAASGAKTAAETKAAADKALAEAKTAQSNIGKTAAQLAAEAKAAADAKAKTDAAAAKAAADAAAAAAAKKSEEAKAAQVAAEEALRTAKNAAEVQTAKNAEMLANAKAALAAKELEDLKKKAEADTIAAKAAADAALAKAIADAKTASDKAASDAAIKAAQDAKAAADAAAAAAARDAQIAAAETGVANATANINVTGNTMLPLPGETPADTYARIAAEQLKMETRQSTIQTLTDRFNKYNLNGLAATIKKLAIEGANEATITLALQETPEYKDRFKANEIRQQKGLSVLDPGTYLKNEASYRQVLREYGLKQFDTNDYVTKFIANDVSPTEFSNRIVTAVQRVQNADPAISKQLRDYYGIGQADLVAYVLDPEQQFQKIERQVAASEIGVAAARQGLTAGVSVAEQLAAQGVTEAQAQKGYSTIADILPSAEKLSQIYGTTMDTYGQSEAEQEVFNSLASAQRKRQQLTAREVAAFSGSAGAAKTSLSTSRVGQF